jgi:hypothetical protein
MILDPGTRISTGPLALSCFAGYMFSRRSFIAMSTLALPEFLHATTKRFSELPAAFAALERANGGRLGIAVRDIATGEGTGYRADERFPMCSTFNSFSRLQSCSASIAIRKP